MNDIYTKLCAPFDESELELLPGAVSNATGQWMCRAMTYVDARAILKRLDEVCGPFGWQKKLTSIPGGMICELGIFDTTEWIWKAGAADNTDIEAIKGGESGALKRAASTWGIGRYLYDLPAQWLPCEVQEKGGRTVFKAWKKQAATIPATQTHDEADPFADFGGEYVNEPNPFNAPQAPVAKETPKADPSKLISDKQKEAILKICEKRNLKAPANLEQMNRAEASDWISKNQYKSKEN